MTEFEPQTSGGEVTALPTESQPLPMCLSSLVQWTNI